MNKLLSKSFLWMFIGLMVTFLTGYVVSLSDTLINAILESPLFYISIILEFVLVIFFSRRVTKMQPTAAKASFLLYSFVSGLTFSSVFILFKISSIIFVFLITAIIFATFGALGYFTKLDLTKLGTYLLMGLVGVILCFIINIFLKNETFDLIVTIIALIIFIGFTAYDVQKIKKQAENGMNNDIVAINGAFELYLDFINIFLHLLDIIGDAKN